MFRKTLLGTTLGSFLLGTAAIAQTTATATTDLNMRTGPGPAFDVVSVIPAQGNVAVAGCLEAANWCEVTHDGVEGWAYGAYLAMIKEEEPVAVTSERARTRIRTVTYEEDGRVAAAGGAAGAIAGALLGGPVGAAVGAAAGLGIGAAATPSRRVVTYVRENPVEPVFLSGEVVVGAGVPEDVSLVEIPESDFMYGNVNSVPVIVDPADRRIVYILR